MADLQKTTRSVNSELISTKSKLLGLEHSLRARKSHNQRALNEAIERYDQADQELQHVRARLLVSCSSARQKHGAVLRFILSPPMTAPKLVAPLGLETLDL